MARCDGCHHNWYSAPSGQQGYPGCDPILTTPHSRCTYLKAYIPIVIEKIRGCDGTSSNVWVRSEMPDDCPVYGAAAKEATGSKSRKRSPMFQHSLTNDTAFNNRAMGIEQ